MSDFEKSENSDQSENCKQFSESQLSETEQDKILKSLEFLKSKYPGKALEIRIPGFGAIQCFEGVKHTRGKPPNVFQAGAKTWLELISGEKKFQEVETEVDYYGTKIPELIDLFPLNF